jgi:hypothetical protein
VIDLDRIPARNPNAAFRVYDGQATIVLPDRAEVNVLNEVGSLVWERIDGRRSVREIRDLVLQDLASRAIEVTREQAEKDILEFVADLESHEMVK